MSGYVINTVSGVVHTERCAHGPKHKRSVGGYEPLPRIAAINLPDRMLCRHCLSWLIGDDDRGVAA